MNKPPVSHKLSKIALWCSAAAIFCQLLAVAFPQQIGFLFYNGLHTLPELPASGRGILLCMALSSVPMLAVAVWSQSRQTITQNNAMALTVLAPALYGLSALFQLAMRMAGNTLISHVYGSKELAAFSLANSAVTQFAWMHTIPLVLLTCAGAIELFALKYLPDAPAFQVTQPVKEKSHA